MSIAHRKARHLQAILEWKSQRLDSYVSQEQLELCKRFVSDSAVLLRRIKIQSPVLMKKCHAFAFCFLSIKVSMFLSQNSNCDYTCNSVPVVNRSACSTGKIFCLPYWCWKCFFIFQHAVCRQCIALGLTSGPESSPQKGSGLQPKWPFWGYLHFYHSRFIDIVSLYILSSMKLFFKMLMIMAGLGWPLAAQCKICNKPLISILLSCCMCCFFSCWECPTGIVDHHTLGFV